MEVRAPEAGLPIDRDMILMMTVHQVLVRERGARPIRLKFLVDSQRLNGIDGHYESEYELENGTVFRVWCKLSGDDVLFKIRRGPRQMNYTVALDRFVDDDLMPTSMDEYETLVEHWMSD